MASDVMQKIDQLVKGNNILLFMKGDRQVPQCGFSAAVIQCLNEVGAKYETVNVLADEEIRSAIKTYANWPTIPQLYINGQFIGGCDIVREMFSSGELKKTVETVQQK